MWSPIQGPVFALYALSAAVIGIHLLLLATWTGTVRTFKKEWVNPEDAARFKGPKVDVDHPDVARVKRAHMNALENAVPFLAIGFLYALTGPSTGAAQIYFGIFVAARLLHSIFYLAQLQPFRTITFFVGMLATVGMGVQVIRSAIALL